MESIKTTARIHPLMAAAAVSVIVVSLAGTAAITGMLPSSHSAPQPAETSATPYALTQGVQSPAAVPAAPLPGVPAGAAQAQQPVQAAYGQAMPASYNQPEAYAQPVVAAAQPAPTVIKETIIKEVPAKPVHKVHHHASSYARNDAPASYQPAPYAAPAPAPAHPNYVAIGTGAVVGGLIGNQVGSGNGRKLATIAGMIGGGFLGNQMANQNR